MPPKGLYLLSSFESVNLALGDQAVHLQLGGDDHHPHLHHRGVVDAGAEAQPVPGHLQERGFLQHGFHRRQHHDGSQPRCLLSQLLCLPSRIWTA